ncbi:hypothetical protein [Sphingomonas sp. ID0503]|uniref:hypothetical protein n=1 Tax=Sphingomonas sp. ID0503 TaxID=3399691 RepID=UPI003AFA7044
MITSAEPDVTLLFSTPLIVDEIAVQPALRAVIEERWKRSLSRRVAGEGWSETSFETWGGEPATQLIQDALARVRSLTRTASGEVAASVHWRVKATAHLADPGEQLTFRMEPSAFWSGLYTVANGYAGALDPSAGGEFAVLDPRSPVPLMETAELRLRTRLGAQPRSYAEEAVLRPASGKLLLLPAWVRVDMRRFQGSARRLIVSLSFTPYRLG